MPIHRKNIRLFHHFLTRHTESPLPSQKNQHSHALAGSIAGVIVGTINGFNVGFINSFVKSNNTVPAPVAGPGGL